MSEEISLGTLIDAEQEEFQEYIKDQNVGILSNLKLLMGNAFSELKLRKDALIQSKTISREEVENSVQKVYAEMLKIEDKYLILTSRIEELTKKVFDTEKS